MSVRQSGINNLVFPIKPIESVSSYTDTSSTRKMQLLLLLLLLPVITNLLPASLAFDGRRIFPQKDLVMCVKVTTFFCHINPVRLN